MAERRGLTAAIALGVAAVGVAALVYFDLGPPLPFNDDWIHAWSVRELVAGHGLRILPEQGSLALVQVFWGTVATLGHPDQRFLRLALVPFAVLAAALVYRVSRQLGADRTWALLAAVTLFCTPVFLATATSYMPDLIYFGLLMAAITAAIRWLRGETGPALCVVLALMAFAQRQHGLGIAGAVTLVLVINRRRRPITVRDWLGVAALWILPAILWGVLAETNLLTITQVRQVQFFGAGSAGGIPLGLLYFGVMFALFTAPMLVGVATSRAVPGLRGSRIGLLVHLVSLFLGVITVVLSLRFLKHGLNTLTGDYLTAFGLGPTHLMSLAKPMLFGSFVLRGLEVVMIAGAAILLVFRSRVWAQAASEPAGQLLMVAAMTQMVPLVQIVIDRYYLPVAALLLPVMAAAATRTTRPRAAQAWAIVALAGFVGIYVVGEQDYQAWQVARSAAAEIAYSMAPADQVQAGYEVNAVRVALPYYVATGNVLWGTLPTYPRDLPEATGPPHPALRLRFAPLGDPRPGVDYRSLASGRIVIEDLR